MKVTVRGLSTDGDVVVVDEHLIPEDTFVRMSDGFLRIGVGSPIVYAPCEWVGFDVARVLPEQPAPSIQEPEQ